MPEALSKLTPSRDLQCYFERPSAIAAISEASASGFTLSGCWRQQFDWAVVEWNRDNVIEHPALRYLPDGDLSGLTLSYVETRENCITLDSTWYPTVDWPFLRIWAEEHGSEQLYKVPLKDYAAPAEGTASSAWAEFELGGAITPGDYVELSWLAEHFTIQLFAGQTLEEAVQLLCDAINEGSFTASATSIGARIKLEWRDAGANSNRIGIYGNVSGARTESWTPAYQIFHDGFSPSAWRVTLDFSSLLDVDGRSVPTHNVRKMRWTYSADIQAGEFERSEFAVHVSDWTVTGAKRIYSIAGSGSRRVEDDSRDVTYSGTWLEQRGNFSGGSIHRTSTSGSFASCKYEMPCAHKLYLGTRRHASAPVASITVNGSTRNEKLAIVGEDVLVRIFVAELAPGSHTVQIRHVGSANEALYVDFFEIAVPSIELPEFPPDPFTTLATDWDTDHSITIAPERAAWLMHKLGFHGRANYYVGALWFYELWRPENRYGSATIEFQGIPTFGHLTEIMVGPTTISHRNLIGDTAESIARAFAFEINAGSTALWAQADENVLQLRARAMGTIGEALSIGVNTNSETLVAEISGATLSGAVDGAWLTDMAATPRVNRACRDWSRSFCRALATYGIEVTAAFSMELQHGDPSPGAGIAQRYPGGAAAMLNTPALQTNFSPASTNFWKVVYLDMADVLAEAGCRPYLQFGEVQWWYFPSDGGMPFYDEYTKSRFESVYGRPMHIFADGNALPAAFPEECEYLSALIGEFTDSIMDFVREKHPNVKFEVLYPPDVNEAPLNRVINYPRGSWSPTKLNCLKTENFTYTGNRDLDLCKTSIRFPIESGFSPSQSSHLVGIWDHTTPWLKEFQASRSEGVESVVLFALDQFCLIGYGAPLNSGSRRSFES
jgi:hypothetical protein